MLCIYRENHEAGSSMENKTFEERKKIIYEFISDPHYVPMKQKELAVILQVAKEDREELGRVLEALLGEGKIELSKRGRYSKAQPRKAVGTFTSHARGFGFVSVEGQEQDIFIGENDTGDAFLGDTVEVAVKGRGGRRPEGVITKVLAHSVTEVIGTFERSKNFGFVIPDNQRINRDIFIPLERTRGAVTGQKVTAEITDYGRGRKNPEGRITQILGEASDPETEVLSIIMAYGLPTEFPERVENQAERVAKPVSAADRAGRLDLREEPPVEVADEAWFFRVARGAFAQRRKTAANSLSSALGIPKPQVEAALAAVGAAGARAERLTLEQLAALSNRLLEAVASP